MTKLTNWFLSQVGTVETETNNVKYNTEFYGHEVNGDAYAWCCAFIWCGFKANGLLSAFCGGNKTAYCPYVHAWAVQHGQWVTSGFREGDIVLYDWDGDGTADHIGYVVSGGNRIDVIEGNLSDKVQRIYRASGVPIGAYRPNYPAETENVTEVEKMDEYIVKKGDTLWSIAEKYLGAGNRYNELLKLNEISNPNGLQVGMVLKLQTTTPEADGETVETEKPQATRNDKEIIIEFLENIIKELKAGD